MCIRPRKKIAVLPASVRACLKVAWLHIFIESRIFKNFHYGHFVPRDQTAVDVRTFIRRQTGEHETTRRGDRLADQRVRRQ